MLISTLSLSLAFGVAAKLSCIPISHFEPSHPSSFTFEESRVTLHLKVTTMTFLLLGTV